MEGTQTKLQRPDEKTVRAGVGMHGLCTLWRNATPATTAQADRALRMIHATRLVKGMGAWRHALGRHGV
ncbi:hypothetical protein [Comamonas sp. 17RB]|uniref:hypothetical protein n=1 Tax=Comamonas sp. 17RB TaxID=3047025 RepID=UPI0024B69334|nr:hypothetical protein [Comamonas sp. 17RB]MDI9856507.1 hypothetical protein [Comamonas sp. 17RB]